MKDRHGRHFSEHVQGIEGVLEQERVPEIRWVWSEKEEQGRTGFHPEEAFLEDQDRSEDPESESGFAEEAVGVAEKRLRENDDGIG